MKVGNQTEISKNAMFYHNAIIDAFRQFASTLEAKITARDERITQLEGRVRVLEFSRKK